MPTRTLARRNVRTQRHHNDVNFIALADAIDRVLSRHGLVRVDNPGSVSWKLPSGHHMAGVAGAELTFEGSGRSFGFNEGLALSNPQVAQSTLFRSAFKVIPARDGTASFLDFRLVQDPARRCQDLEKMCLLLGLINDEVDSDSFSAALQSL
jgi:hypothetical protein